MNCGEDKITDKRTQPILPRFALHVPTLSQDTLPNIIAIVQAMQETLK